MTDRKTILIVEDEQLMVNALKRKLEDEGFNTLVAEDGLGGLKTALKEHPDLILLDIILPIMDGVSVLEKLREDEWGKDVPVIVLSNLSRATTVAESKEKGVKFYLVKTNWTLKEVVQKVKYELGIL